MFNSMSAEKIKRECITLMGRTDLLSICFFGGT